MEHINNISIMQPVGESPAADVPDDCVSDNVTFESELLRELPVPEAQDMVKTGVYESPRGEIEEELADIWSETLKMSPVGRNDGFFELGGDSLLATTILHKIQDVFGVELPLRAIFELQTIKAVAEAIDNIYIGTTGDVMEETIV